MYFIKLLARSIISFIKYNCIISLCLTEVKPFLEKKHWCRLKKRWKAQKNPLGRGRTPKRSCRCGTGWRLQPMAAAVTYAGSTPFPSRGTQRRRQTRAQKGEWTHRGPSALAGGRVGQFHLLVAGPASEPIHSIVPTRSEGKASLFHSPIIIKAL